MKRIIAFILPLLLAVNIMPVTAHAEKQPYLLTMGDSIATGFRLYGYVSGDNTSAKDSFSNRLSADFGNYLNFAEDGKTTSQLLNDIETNTVLRKSAKKADYAVISIGGNDFLTPMIEAYRSNDQTSSGLDRMQKIMDGTMTWQDAVQETFDKAYESTVEAAKSVDTEKSAENIAKTADILTTLNKNIKIYILTVYDPFEGIPAMERAERAAGDPLGRLNDGIKAIAESRGNVYIVDVFTAFSGHTAEYTNMLTMDIHPNKKGHDVIYKLLLSEFEKNPGFRHKPPEKQQSGTGGEEINTVNVPSVVSKLSEKLQSFLKQ